MPNGRASSESDASRPASRARIARRVGSESAANVASSRARPCLTIWLTYGTLRDPSSARVILPGSVIYTIGHSTRGLAELVGLLTAQGVAQVVDVRRYPASRRHPQFAQAALAAGVAARGLGYRHEPDLGGRRSPRRDSANTAWRSAGFRGYADYMETDAFQAALERLIAVARAAPTAILCAEALPWRCHRHLIADALVAQGDAVAHILGRGELHYHELSPHAQLAPGGTLRYPARPAVQHDLRLDAG
jgi:Protein of unknown function, DUF488